jgi:RHS repeat-associated protein
MTAGGQPRLIADLNELAVSTQRAGGANPIALLNLADIVAKDLQSRLLSEETPEAYLIYALYDQDSNRYEVGKKVLTRNAANQHEVLEENLYISLDGYMETFLVNETAEDVWFDNFMVMSMTDPVAQETHYDPWGLELTGIGSQYGGIKANKYLYQGKELIDDLSLNLYDFHARGYDPAIGRTWQMDPHAENYYNWSPYSWTFNNPINIIDPDGRDGVATIDKENKTVQVSQAFHYSNSNAEVLKKALSNLGNGSMTIDEFMADFDSNWGGEASSMEIDGEEYSVGYSATFVAHDDDASRDEAVAADPTSNSLVFDRDLGPAGNWNGKSRTLSINPLKVRYDNTTFSHEAGHSMGLGHSDPTTSRDAQGNELSGGIMSYAWNRQVTPSERRATIYDAVNLSKAVKDTRVRVHIKGYWSKDHKNSPTIIK